MSARSSLVSTVKTSDSGLHASLHPLVLLTISDYITRHTLRHQTQPIVGALLGQQKGREITIEHAYEVKLLDPSLPVPGAFEEQEQEGEPQWKLHEAWFADRLQQYKDVHKDPALELVGWWTMSPPEGPGSEVLGIHRHILQTFNESSLLLAFHANSVKKQRQASSQNHQGQQMPLTIYESVYESKKEDEDADKMQVEEEGGDKTANSALEIKLRQLPYEIVTGEAEMISVDFVAKGGGNATAVETGVVKGKADGADKKGKGKAVDTVVNGSTGESTASVLNPEEEELMSFLSSRANAIKMLQSRLSLLRTYLTSLPACYLTDASLPSGSLPNLDISTTNTTTTDRAQPPKISHQTLRSLLALTSCLPHLQPSDSTSFARDQAAERSDVAIVSLLGSLGRSVSEAKELGRTFGTVENMKSQGKRNAERFPSPAGGMPPGMNIGMGMGMDIDGRNMDYDEDFERPGLGMGDGNIGWDDGMLL